jgi:membrane protein implicated in regulation of membrane protease activity
MKNLPAIISLFATVSLALLAAAAALGVSCPYWTLALQVAGFAWAAGVLAIFLTDYAPNRATAAIRVMETPRENVPATARAFDDTVIGEVMATLGLDTDQATVSLS